MKYFPDYIIIIYSSTDVKTNASCLYQQTNPVRDYLQSENTYKFWPTGAFAQKLTQSLSTDNHPELRAPKDFEWKAFHIEEVVHKIVIHPEIWCNSEN